MSNWDLTQNSQMRLKLIAAERERRHNFTAQHTPLLLSCCHQCQCHDLYLSDTTLWQHALGPFRFLNCKDCKESEADYKLRITRGLISYFTGTLTFPRGMCAYLPALRARWPDHPASPRYKCDRQRRCRYCVAALPTCDNMRCWTGSIVRRNTDDAGHNSPLLCVVTVYCPVMLLRRAEETLTVMCMGRVLSLRQ